MTTTTPTPTRDREPMERPRVYGPIERSGDPSNAPRRQRQAGASITVGITGRPGWSDRPVDPRGCPSFGGVRRSPLPQVWAAADR